MTTPRPKELKERVLIQRGQGLQHHGRVVRLNSDPPDGKTSHMRLIEAQFGVSIEQLIGQGSVRSIARRLGISFSTISRWRARLGIR